MKEKEVSGVEEARSAARGASGETPQARGGTILCKIIRLWRQFSRPDWVGFGMYLEQQGIPIYRYGFPPTFGGNKFDSTTVYDDGTLIIKRIHTIPPVYGIYLRYPSGKIAIVGYYGGIREGYQ